MNAPRYLGKLAKFGASLMFKVEKSSAGRNFGPTIVRDPTRGRFLLFVRLLLGIIGANDFLQL